MQTPHIVMNWMAIVVAVVVAFAVGGLWYGPLFGKPWAKLMGMKMDKKPKPKVMAKAFGLQILGLVLTTWVMFHCAEVWRHSVWGVGQDGPGYMYGFFGGFYIWIGFYIPMQLGKVSWEGRPWKLFLINTGHDFVVLQTIAQILENWPR